MKFAEGAEAMTQRNASRREIVGAIASGGLAWSLGIETGRSDEPDASQMRDVPRDAKRRAISRHVAIYHWTRATAKGLYVVYAKPVVTGWPSDAVASAVTLRLPDECCNGLPVTVIWPRTKSAPPKPVIRLRRGERYNLSFEFKSAA